MSSIALIAERTIKIVHTQFIKRHKMTECIVYNRAISCSLNQTALELKVYLNMMVEKNN